MISKSSTYILLLMVVMMIATAQDESEKCGTFRVVQELTQRKLQQSKLLIVPRPILQTSILTKNGKIRIHFDTTGINQPAMVTVSVVNGSKVVSRVPNSYRQWIDTLATILDSVWRTEIDHFEFTAPPTDALRGGGDEYDFYVIELGGGLFGVTNIESDLPVGPVKTNQQYATFINIDNDFGSGYRTNGIEAVMATSAHEFHHAIQVGGSGLWEVEQFYFYELCAEALENTVFRDAKDYLFDVKTYFSNISTMSLFQLSDGTISHAGYERAIWGMFLMKKYGPAIMKDIWNQVKTNRPITALNISLNVAGTSVQREFSDFLYWNYFTSHRADSVRYYTDAKAFPPVSVYQTVIVNAAQQSVQLNTRSFIPYYIKATTVTDSVFFIIANMNFNDAVNNAQQSFPAELRVTTTSGGDYTSVAANIFAKFFATDIENWSYKPIGTVSPTTCFPNPMNPSASSLLISLNGIGAGDNVTLTIISAVSLDLVFSKHAEYTLFSGIKYAEWNGRDQQGHIVPSGVYLYILSNGSNIVKGKFAVIR
ncbi:MAG: MXAN_6640 family putative metalloprotease [Bacteroidota bacterium]